MDVKCKMNCYGGISSYEAIPGISKVEEPFFAKDYTLTVGESRLFRVVISNHYEVTDDKVTLTFTTPDFKSEYQEIQFNQVSQKVWELTSDLFFDGADEYGVLIYARAKEKYTHIETETINATLDIETGDYLPGERTVKAIANPGYEFQVIPSVTDDIKHHYDFEKVDDSTYQITLDFLQYRDYKIVAEAVKKSIVVDRYGTVTVYRPTKDDMKQISAKRWIQKVYKQMGDTVTLTDEYIDTAKYIVSLIKLFAKVDISSREKVYFGPYDMGLDCDVVGNDILTLNCGNVRIAGIHGNSIDYDDTEIEAYLPFIGFVTLKTADFMDKEISLEYQVNVINGDGLAVFKANGQVVASYSCNISFRIPYQMGGGEYQNTELQVNTNYLLNEPPFIYVKSHNAINPDENLPYHDTNFYSCFGELTGYTEAKEIDLHIVSPHITKQEIDEIKQLLENGVFL